MSNLEFKIPQEWEERIKDSWRSFIPEIAKDNLGIEYLRNLRDEKIYRISIRDTNGEKIIMCNNCEGEVSTQRVVHLIYFNENSTNKIKTEYVPYCKKCDNAPQVVGDPVYRF